MKTKLNINRNLKLNICNIILFILTLILICYYKNNIKEKIFDLDISFHFNLIVSNSIMLGFLFTGLTIMISSLDKPRIKRLNDNFYLNDYFNGIYLAIICLCFSIITGLMIIVISIDYLVKIEICSMFIGMTFFIKSILKMLILLNKIRFE